MQVVTLGSDSAKIRIQMALMSNDRCGRTETPESFKQCF